MQGNVHTNFVFSLGRIINEAGETEPQGPGPDRGPDSPVQKKFLERKFAVL